MKYKEWLNIWIENYIKPSAKVRTYIRYEQLIRMHIVVKLGDLDVNDLTPIVLQSFVTELLNTGNLRTGKKLSPNFVNVIISVIQNSLKTANLVGIAIEYTANKIKRPKTVERQIDCFSGLEQKKIETHVLNSNKDKLFGIVLCLYTGLRIGELLALTWSDIDFGKRCYLFHSVIQVYISSSGLPYALLDKLALRFQWFSSVNKIKNRTLLKCTPNVGYSWGIIRVGSLLPTRFSFPHAILMRFNPNRIVAN